MPWYVSIIVNSRSRQQRSRRDSRGRSLLVLLMAISTFVGEGFSTCEVLLHEHEHGTEGHHHHVLIELAPGSAAVSHEHHGLDLHDASGHAQVPSGSIGERPVSPLRRPGVTRSALTSVQRLSCGTQAVPGSDVLQFHAAECLFRDPPAVRQSRLSGAMRVLRTSGALLI
jgi:hypothetical protein